MQTIAKQKKRKENQSCNSREDETVNLGGLILLLKFSYSGSKYGQQTFAIYQSEKV